MIMLENDLIKLRAVEPNDLELIYKWENNTDAWKVGNTLTPYAKYQIKKYIQNSNEDIYTTKQFRLMIDIKGISEKTVGCVDFFDLDVYHQKAAVGIFIQEEYRHKGIAKNALHLFVNYCFSFLHFHQLYCHVDVKNKHSIELFRQANFKESGMLKDWIKTSDKYSDVVIFQLINNQN